MKYLFSLALTMVLCVSAQAQITPEWVRYPAISPDGETIAFTYKGDLYTVPSAGGEALRLTFHQAHDYMPVWSNDSRRLAFASDRHGNFDVFVMDAAGGPATRLTFHSNGETPYAFSNDNASVFFGAHRQDLATHRQYPTSGQTELYTVPVQGGNIEQVFTVPAEHIALKNNGSGFLYQDKPEGENIWRKHHESSVTRDIWMYDMKKGAHTKLTEYGGEDRDPVWNQDESAFFYLSQQNGTFNVHKMDIATKAVTQVTDLKTHPVRFLSHGNGMLAFSYHGVLHSMREGGSPVRVPVTIRTQDVKNAEELVRINGGVSEMAVSPDGKQIAFIARGEVFVTSTDGNFTRRLTKTPATERFLTWTGDGSAVVYSSERNGKWSIYQTKKVREEEPFFYAATLLSEEVVIENNSDNYLPNISPDGKKMAFIEDRRTLKVMDMESKKTVTLLTPEKLFHMRDGDKYFTWSPDSKWLLADFSKLLNNSDIILLDASGKEKMKVLVPSGYYDRSPQWANEGKQMIWFSNRNGLKSYATSGSTEYDVYSMFFTQDAWDQYNLSKEEYELKKAIAEANKKKEKDAKKDEKEDKDKEKDEDKEKEKDKSLKFDWDGMDDRTARLTIHSSRIGDAVLSKDGSKLYYLARFEKGYNLWSTDLRTKETKIALTLNGGSGNLVWDPKMETLYLLSGGRIAKIDPGAGKRTGISIRSEMMLDGNDEREMMFDHVVLRTEKIFYEPTFHGIDWEAMAKAYKPKVAHVGNGFEFAELLSELLGELNVSHAGSGYRGGSSNGDQTASLGIFMDYEHEGDGIKILEVLKGGPLDKADIEVEPGMIIQKIDGEVVSENRDLASYLNRKAGDFMLLEITDEKGRNAKQITVKPVSLGAENGLLYNRWVKMNEEEVEKRSKGRLGYVHIAGMNDGQFRKAIDQMLGKHYDKEAIVIDTRNNGGGDLVADLQMFFTGTRFLTYATEAKVVGGEPTSRWTKPVIGLFNESMYSDGHCYASGYEDLDLGTSVGMPVPGTCSFAGWEGLPNGGYWGVVPVSAKNKAGEWLENNQTNPDIMVKNMPGEVDFGRDEQLEVAIDQMLKELDAKK
ncbi:MAG: S41 family peptidase [Bacteroidota bacterium]